MGIADEGYAFEKQLCSFWRWWCRGNVGKSMLELDDLSTVERRWND